MRRDPPHDFLFYSPQLDRRSNSVELTGDEHHHLTRVLRMSAGQTVYATSGRGVIARCRILTIDGRSTRLGVEETVEECGTRGPSTLALACLKKDAFELAVRQCTELGITRFVPFASAKSHVTEYTPAFLERLGRVALSAMKQSFRATLPTVVEPVSFETLVGEALRNATVVVGDAAAAPLRRRPRPRPLMMVVGPEGGLTEAERNQLASAGCEFAAVSLHRLRSETAATTLTAIVLSQPIAASEGEPDSIDRP